MATRAQRWLAGLTYAAFAGLAAAAGGGCAIEPLAVPDAPRAEETAAIAAVYDAPTGTLDLARIDAKAAEVAARFHALQLDWLPEYAAAVLARVADGLEGQGFPIKIRARAGPKDVPGGEALRLSAVTEIHLVCQGWDDPDGAPDPDANGVLDMTAVIYESRLRQDLWGTATGCRARLDAGHRALGGTVSVNAYFHGSLFIMLLGSLPRTFGDAAFLLRFEGYTGLVGDVSWLAFDFRVTDVGIEFRHPVEDGDVIVRVDGAGLTLRGRNASVLCELSTLSCRAS